MQKRWESKKNKKAWFKSGTTNKLKEKYLLSLCISFRLCHNELLCSGEQVSVDEQVNLREAVTESLKESASMQSLPPSAAPASAPAGSGAPLTSEERMQYEQEKLKLYTQLDEKVGTTQCDCGSDQRNLSCMSRLD